MITSVVAGVIVGLTVIASFVAPLWILGEGLGSREIGILAPAAPVLVFVAVWAAGKEWRYWHARLAGAR